MPSSSQHWVAWSEEEKHRLVVSRDEQSHLTWKEFLEVNPFPGRTHAAIQNMYFKVKARNAEGSDDESEWEDQSGDGDNGGDEGEKPAEAETATDAAANKPKRGLIEYELTDGEISDPVNLRKDSDIAPFNSSTLPPKKQKQQRPKSIPVTTASRDIRVDSQSRPLTPTAGPWFPTEYPELPGTLALAKRRTQLSLGEHLKQRQLQKAALHNKLEENIKELQARSDTAREDSEHAAALYTKLQRLGGLLNLSASEADALMDVVRASDFTTDSAPMK